MQISLQLYVVSPDVSSVHKISLCFLPQKHAEKKVPTQLLPPTIIDKKTTYSAQSFRHTARIPQYGKSLHIYGIHIRASDRRETHTEWHQFRNKRPFSMNVHSRNLLKRAGDTVDTAQGDREWYTRADTATDEACGKRLHSYEDSLSGSRMGLQFAHKSSGILTVLKKTRAANRKSQ